MADFEHALFMLLLLVGIFSARPPQQRLALGFIVGGILLALLPPFIRISVPWDAILTLAVPLLFWQNARHWLHARWRVGLRELVLWIVTIFALAGVLNLTGYLTWPGALLFGVVAASLLWRAVESEQNGSQIGEFGPLTLIILLTEIAPAVETPNRYLGGLFSGAAVGIAVAFLSIYLSQRLLPQARGWVALGQAYLAYWLAAAIDVSGVVAALISIGIYAEGSLRRGIYRDGLALPAPLNSWPVFVSGLALFAFIGWQAHQPLSAALVLESFLGLLVGILVAWIGRILSVSKFAGLSVIWRSGLQVGLFLFAALLLWPRETLLDPIPLAAALGLAILISGISAVLLSATLSLQEDTG